LGIDVNAKDTNDMTLLLECLTDSNGGRIGSFSVVKGGKFESEGEEWENGGRTCVAYLWTSSQSCVYGMDQSKIK
jgi:hypothetical protein